MERVALVRALTGEVIHPEVEAISGDDTRGLSRSGDMSFRVSLDWHKHKAADGSYFLDKRKTFVVVERANRTIRQVGLVDDLVPDDGWLQVSCGGFSMLAGQSGPWEGHQGYYVTTDPVVLFRRIWEQVQAYKNADLGIRVTGAERSGSYVGSEGSQRYQEARRQYNQYKPQLDKAEGHLLNAERVLSNRTERLFKAATLKRVGDVTQQEKEPDNPHYKRDSTIWVNNAWRAHVWREGQGWVPQSQADDAVYDWRNGVATRDRAKDRVDYLKYRIEPAQELMDEYEDEARDEYSLYFWQNHDMGDVIDDLLPMGPFEFREQAAWVRDEDGNDRLDLQLEVGVPRVGVRRPELHLEFGHNVQGEVKQQYGPVYTGIAQFGAGTGSEVLSEQRDWNPKHVVRNILTETDKDAYNRALVRNAANKTRDRVQAETGLQFVSLTIYHDKACPEGAFDVGDELLVTGYLQDGHPVNQWVRVLTAKTPWGADETVIEVENV